MRSRGWDPRKVVRSKTTFDAPLKKTRDGEWQIPDGSFVFVCPLGDFFHDDAEPWRDEATDIMLQRPGVTFLIVTKRAEQMQEWASQQLDFDGSLLSQVDGDAAYAHMWLLVTAENQEMADERIPVLLATHWPGKKGVSIEPQIGPVDLNAVPRTDNAYLKQRGETGVLPDKGEPDDYVWSLKESQWGGISWVICGAESGPGCRPFALSWPRDLRDQCKAAGVPFWMKQLGGWPNRREKLEEFPPDLRIRERPSR
jgi:protein gp37